MFREIVRTQWKWSRGFVLLATVAVFAIPLLSLRTARAGGGVNGFLNAMTTWSVGYSAAAAGIGLILAIIAWSPDHRLRHVYALTLPIERWRYVLLRLEAGALFIVPPVAAVLISGELVARSASIPLGLHAYPGALAIRFALAALVSYSIFFAITSATARTAGILIALIAGVGALVFLLQAANVNMGFLSRWTEVVFATPGLLAVFGGRWMLIDV